MAEIDLMEKIVSLSKRRGFVFQGSEIYGGLAGTWDYGPLGVLLKENVKSIWKDLFIDKQNVYPIDAAILMNPKVWEASGHVAGFSDPLTECKKCKQRERPDILLARDAGEAIVIPSDPELQIKMLNDRKLKCPAGGVHEWMPARQFNMMFKTHAGATEDESAEVYLRPETAGGIFVNFKNVLDSLHPKLPFGIGQIGKAFRNEIAPRDFIFRLRELEQMEVEYFVKPAEWEEVFEKWRIIMHTFAKTIGLPDALVHELEVGQEDRAHYSKRTIDFEFDYPFGRKELWGLAYRTDFDLNAHQSASGQNLKYVEEGEEPLVPHVIEPSLGVDRTVLAILTSAYHEDELGGDKRVYLKLSPKVAPFKAMVSPLLKNKPELVEKAKEVRKMLQEKVHPWIVWDDNGNIGKRYRRQDEIGTPWCITVDFDTLGEKPELKDTVTLRDRDTGEQKRVQVDELSSLLLKELRV
jgi:glycyl-tRNA synthetase